MPRITRGLACAAALWLSVTAPALAQEARGKGQSGPQAGKAGQSGAPGGSGGGQADQMADSGGWPKISFDTLASLEYAGMRAPGGTNRGPDLNLRMDSTLLVDISDGLSVDGLFQVKSRSPFLASDPNRNLFINQGAGRKEGGKMKELYVRSGDWRVGKFVQDFGRAYALLASPFADDFVAEPEEGYEPSDMIGVERIHVFDNESTGWRQISASAFMVDQTFLHRSFPFDEGMLRLKDGGVGNTRWPENLMVTYDALNQPIGQWAHMNWQASVIRWGRTYGSQAGEWWTTLGGDLSIPLDGSVASTLGGHYTQIKLYGEAARRENFNGFAGRSRTFLTLSAELLRGPLVLDLTTTERWTSGPAFRLQTDELYSASIGWTLPSQTVAALAVAQERVGDRHGVYAGLRLTQTFTLCSRCIAKGKYY